MRRTSRWARRRSLEHVASFPFWAGLSKAQKSAAAFCPEARTGNLGVPTAWVELEARYTFETERGQLIYVRNCGIRHASPETMAKLKAGIVVDPAEVYCRTTPVFETAAPELQWLTSAVSIGIADRYPSEVILRFWRVK